MDKRDLEHAIKIWDYMRYSESEGNTDIIIGLGSSDTRTAEWCAYLYKSGVSKKVLFTGARGVLTRNVFKDDEAEVFAEIAIKLGVPRADILIEPKATNTGENIRFSYELLDELDRLPETITLVTKPYMLRRAYATFMQQWPGDRKPKIHCSALPVSFDEYCTHKDYGPIYVTNVMVGDLQRIREYPKLGYQIEQDIPDEVWESCEHLVSRGFTKHLIQESFS